MKEFSLLGFVAHLVVVEAELHEFGEALVRKAHEMVEERHVDAAKATRSRLWRTCGCWGTAARVTALSYCHGRCGQNPCGAVDGRCLFLPVETDVDVSAMV